MLNKKNKSWASGIPGASSFGDPCAVLGYSRGACNALGIHMSGVQGKGIPEGDRIRYAIPTTTPQTKPGKLEKTAEVLPVPEKMPVHLPRNGPSSIVVGSFYDSYTDPEIEEAMAEELGRKSLEYRT